MIIPRHAKGVMTVKEVDDPTKASLDQINWLVSYMKGIGLASEVIAIL